MGTLLLLAILQVPGAPAPPPAPSPQQAEPYQPVEPTNIDVQSALKFAMGEQKRLTREPVSLVGIVTAEKAAVSPNFRVCLFADRGGVTERAQVVVSRDVKKKKWSLTIWAWGSCR